MESVFGERSFDVLKTWRSSRLNTLIKSIEQYGEEMGGLGIEDMMTLHYARIAYRGSKRREIINDSRHY